jgi:hypothetical protein
MAADKGGCDDKDKHMVVFSLVPALWNRPCLSDHVSIILKNSE